MGEVLSGMDGTMARQKAMGELLQGEGVLTANVVTKERGRTAIVVTKERGGLPFGLVD